MNLEKYVSELPEEFDLLGREKDYQLLLLYAYNAYYNADPIKTEDLLERVSYRRDNYGFIDGVFINESLEENTIECIHSYYVNKEGFSLQKVLKLISNISAVLTDVCKRKFTGNSKAESLLNDDLNGYENNKIIVRIITNYTCDEEEKYNINKQVENYTFKVHKFDIKGVIDFGDEIEAVVESNKAPFDWVEDGKLTLDQSNNYLKYKDNSIICNISAKSLKDLWAKEGNRGLLAMNLRYYIKSGSIDSKIEESIMFDGDNFWYLNNGIIVVCNDYEVKNNQVLLKQFSIVNGGQTSRMIGNTPFENDFYVSCKIIKNTFESNNEKNMFISKVAEASNTQKPIKAKDIIANRIEQRNLKTMLAENNVFIEIKRGEKCYHEQYPEVWQRTKNNELAQDLYSFVFMEPGPSHNNVSNLLSNDDKYNIIFKDHTYSYPFLRDILFLEKAYKEYQKKVKKEVETEGGSIKKGLVKQGLSYCLATIGYLLKLYYNPEFKNNMQQYRNVEDKYNLYSSELAFMHGFIDKKMSYKDFKLKAFELFDSVFTNLIVPQFELARDSNPTLAYANWVKTNTGFNFIRRMINISVFDNKQTHFVDIMSNYFIKISEKIENQNIDRYYDYCKNNKKVLAKAFNGTELSDKDKALRDELMIFRMNYSIKKNIKDTSVFTDKMLEKLIAKKPIDLKTLNGIINPKSSYHVGKDVLAIIAKYL